MLQPMAETALQTAHNPAAPADERAHAMHEAQAVALPSSVADMAPLIEFIKTDYERQREDEFYKTLAKPNVIPFPSRAVKEHKPGLQSVYINDTYGNSMGEWRERWSGMSFDALRGMVDNTPVLSSVIFTRIRQVKRFTRASEDGKGPGFQIKLKDKNGKVGKTETTTINMLQDFITHCGWEKNPRQRAKLKRDNFSGMMAKLVRDSLTLDSAPIETEYMRDKTKGINGMYAVDGATIRLVNEEGYRGDDELFAVQVVDGNIRAAYTHDDLIYVPRNPRTDVLVGGYGLSETELLVRVVTGFLNAFTYNTKYFDSNAIPKGLLHLSGNYDANDIAAFKRYWGTMVKGINNAWSLPVMVAKDGESKASFENFNADVSEIMFAKWMTFLTSIICALYGIAPDEINFESFTAGTSSLSGSDTEEKLINSKDKGLRPLLSHFEDLFSDYVIAEFGDKYQFRFTGLDEEDPDKRWEKDQAVLTVNESRKSQGFEPIKDAWGDAPLNPNLIPVWQAENQANAEDYGDPDAAPGEPGQPGQPGGKPGQPGGFGAKPGQPQGAPGGAPDDNGPDMQKAFGLPVLTIEP